MSEIPKPASPLPWFKGGGNPTRPYVVATTSPYGEVRSRLEIVRGEPTGGGAYHPAITSDEREDDTDYLVWAANNAPKFAERIERLEAELESIRKAMGGYPDSDLASLATTLKVRDGRCDQLEAALREAILEHEDQADNWAYIEDDQNAKYHRERAATLRKALE